jgi:hypothetical protein
LHLRFTVEREFTEITAHRRKLVIADIPKNMDARQKFVDCQSTEECINADNGRAFLIYALNISLPAQLSV